MPVSKKRLINEKQIGTTSPTRTNYLNLINYSYISDFPSLKCWSEFIDDTITWDLQQAPLSRKVTMEAARGKDITIALIASLN